MRVNNKQILTSGNMASATLTSSSGQLDQAFGYSIQAVWSGSPVGTIKLQASVDNTTWDDIANSSQAVSGAGSFIWNVADVNYPYARLVYTKGSGTGTLNAYLFYRGF